MNPATKEFLREQAPLIKALVTKHDLLIPLLERGKAVHRAAQIYLYLCENPNATYSQIAAAFELCAKTAQDYALILRDAEVAQATSSGVARTEDGGRPLNQVKVV